MLPIVLRGARTHHLKGVDLELAPGTLVALTRASTEAGEIHSTQRCVQCCRDAVAHAACQSAAARPWGLSSPFGAWLAIDYMRKSPTRFASKSFLMFV